MSHRPTPGAGAPGVPAAPVFPLRRHVALLVVATLVLLTGFGAVLTHDDRAAAAAGVHREAGAPDDIVPVEVAGVETHAPEPPEAEIEAPAPPPEPAPEPAPAARPDLPARIDAVLADPALADRLVGVTVTDADGRVIFERGGELPLLPASTQKLVVAAGALTALGGDFRYETRLRATAVPADGVLHGSLVLVGAGDPTLATPAYGSVIWARPRTPLESLADQVVAAGITHVAGDIYGDPSIFDDEPVARGWAPHYISDGHAGLVSGLTVDAGRHMLQRNGRWQSVPSANPADEAAAALGRLLAERGVSLGGATGSTRTPPPAPVEVASVHSPPLVDILRYMVQRSDNHIADAVFRTIGAHTTGAGSWGAAAHGVTGALAGLGLDWSGTSLADGSGLSREDRLTPRLLTSLDAAMTSSALGPQWQSLMAVSGESGTLLRRGVGTVAQGRVRAKTGTLNDVRALAGTVAGPAHTRYHFAVLGNALDAEGRAAVLALQDRLVITLADDLLGCPRIVEVPPHLRGAHDDPAYDCAA